MTERIPSIIADQFNGRLKVTEKRPGVCQLFLPMYHEDGDMLEIYLQEVNGLWKISDVAMTWMRLSCGYNVDSENKEKIFQKIISENGLNEENGNIFLTATDEALYPSLLQFVAGISKISSMRYFRREVPESLLYEMLDEFIFSELQSCKPVFRIAIL